MSPGVLGILCATFPILVHCFVDTIIGGDEETEEEGGAVNDHGSSNIHGPNRPSAFPDGLYGSYNRLCTLWLRSRRNGKSFRSVFYLMNTQI